MNPIPIHILQERTNLGVQIRHLQTNEIKKGGSAEKAHRDDHYIFFLLESGVGSLMIDFMEIKLVRNTIYYVLPGQVHYVNHGSANADVSGWFVAVEPGLVPQECRKIFEGQLHLQQPYPLGDKAYLQFQSILKLLLDKYHEDETAPFYLHIVHSLLHSFIHLVAGCYGHSVGAQSKVSRPVQLTSQFKQLLNTQVKTIKSPAQYAQLLNVSESYLSEVLKKQTGFPASYWIQQEVLMEAKRLLYYTELTVKEIAHHLGYTDHSYFSRYFRKNSGVSAAVFRQNYRK